jgi:hypothetical protein
MVALDNHDGVYFDARRQFVISSQLAIGISDCCDFLGLAAL